MHTCIISCMTVGIHMAIMLVVFSSPPTSGSTFMKALGTAKHTVLSITNISGDCACNAIASCCTEAGIHKTCSKKYQLDPRQLINACLCLTVTSQCLQQHRKLSRLRAISTFANARCETGIFRPSGRTRYCKKPSGEGQLSRGVSRFWIKPRASTGALPTASAEKACAALASYKAPTFKKHRRRLGGCTDSQML